MMSGGLVQEYTHSVLPAIRPIHTFFITMLAMVVRMFLVYLLNGCLILKLDKNISNFLKIFSIKSVTLE